MQINGAINLNDIFCLTFLYLFIYNYMLNKKLKQNEKNYYYQKFEGCSSFSNPMCECVSVVFQILGVRTFNLSQYFLPRCFRFHAGMETQENRRPSDEKFFHLCLSCLYIGCYWFVCLCTIK